MNREEFKAFVSKSLMELKTMAEQNTCEELPEISSFQWIGGHPEHEGKENIKEAITKVVYVDENSIYPCVDLRVMFDEHNSNKLVVKGSRAGYEPRPFQIGWSGRPGPFIYAVCVPTSPKIDVNSKEFKNKLIDMGLLHYPREK